MKKYPPLESMRIKRPDRPRQSWEQQLAIAQMMSSRGLGKIGKAN
jgi:hypothetical protein